MARKVCNVKPVNEIELNFEDGTVVLLRFDTEALLNFNDLDDGLNGIMEDISVSNMCAKIVYIGAKNQNKDFTYEKAREITSEMSIETVNFIIEEFNESMGASKNEVQSETQKKLMEEFLLKMCKK